MLDFNTKKNILRRLRKKGAEHWYLRLPCAAAAAFVKIWYALACSFVMALSDKQGNFLGVKGLGEKTKRRRQDDIVYVKKPFFGRLLSAVLAAAFVLMVAPELNFLDLGITVSADYNYNVVAPTDTIDPNKIFPKDGVQYYPVPNSSTDYYLLSDYDTALSVQVPQSTFDVKVAYQSARITWDHPEGYAGVSNYTYTVGYIQNGATHKEESGVRETIYTFKDNHKLIETNVNYGFFVIPTTNISVYRLVNEKEKTGTKTDDDGNTVDVYTEVERMRVSGTTRAVEGTAVQLLNAGTADKKIDNPPTPRAELSNDSSAVDLYWEHVARDNTTDRNLAYGYIVYRSTWDSKKSAYGAYEILKGSPFEASTHIMDGTNEVKFSDTTVVAGSLYQYYVRAYRDLYGGTAFIKDQAGIIVSMDETGNPNVSDPVSIPPAAVRNVTVTSNKKDTLTISWDKPINSNVDGYYVYRTDNKTDKEMEEEMQRFSGSLDTNKYYDSANKVWKFYQYIMDNAKQVTQTDKLICTDPIGKDVNAQLSNDDQYYYYVIPYVNADSRGTKKLYGSVASNFGSIGATLTKPQGFIATPGDGRVDLTWNAVPGADGYRVYIKKIANHDGSMQGVGVTVTDDVSKNSYPHVGLYNNDVYEYYVKAYTNVASNNTEDPTKLFSPASDTRRVTVGVELTSPQDLKAVTKDGEITISWSAVKGAEGYILHYWKQYGAESVIDLSKTSFNHTGLTNGDQYYYYVVPYKTVNGVRVLGAQSVTISMIVGDNLDAPKDFNAVTTDGKVNLSWTKVKGAEGYIIFAYSGGRSYQFDVSKEKYEHTGLANGDVWTYYAVAYKTVNSVRTYSNPTRSVTVTIGVSLNSAVDLTATAGNHQIDLSWTKVTGAEGYVVYLYNSKTMEFEPITVTSKTTYSHVGLKNGQKYTYMVAPFKNINGERFYGDYSMPVTATPTTGSVTDIDRDLNVKGTTPYGISHSEYISAKSNHDAFDESVDVYFTTNNESTAVVKDVLRSYANGLSSFIIYPFDISIYREGTRIEVDPAYGYTVTITMPIPDRLIPYRDYITIVHINEDNSDDDIADIEWYNVGDQRLEVLPCAVLDIDNIWCVQFVCSSFSPYAIVIYKDHIQDVSSGGGVADGTFAGSFNSGVLLFTALPDIMPNNRRLKIVRGGKKRYRIKNAVKK